MMHRKNFVCAIKVGGKVLRESSDRVELPFGSEYSVLLKNLDTVRMQAQISIDGQDASGWLVVSPGESVDVERFYRHNRDQGNRFKFIERTERVEEYRGIRAEDGLVRVEFRREKVYELPKIVEHHTYHHHDWPYQYPRTYPWTWPSYPYYTTLTSTQNNTGSLISKSSGISGQSQTTYSGTTNSSAEYRQASQAINAQCYSGPIMAEASLHNDAGITVDGSLSTQKFTPVAGFDCESSDVIILHLVGRKGTASIPVARTVDYRPTCESCGKKNKATSKFCVECGTSLEKF